MPGIDCHSHEGVGQARPNDGPLLYLTPVPLAARVLRVSVVDDEEGVRTTMQLIIGGWEGVLLEGLYSCGREALIGLGRVQPDAVFMDVRLPDLNGIECTRLVKEQYPRMRVVIISGLDDEHTVAHAVSAGCDAYLVKPFSPAQCRATLLCALRRQQAMPLPAGADLTRAVPVACDAATIWPVDRQAESASSPTARPRFSNREIAVLASLRDGLRYKEIAAQLNISLPLAHKLIHRIFGKLHSTCRIEAINRWNSLSSGRDMEV